MPLRRPISLMLVLLSLLAAGCVEVKRQYVINPDLSGKVEVTSLQRMDAFIQSGADAKRPDEEKARRAAKGILENTAGVETWKDVSWRVTDEGKVEFKGTAYFRNFNALNLDTTTKSSNRLSLSSEGGGTVLRWTAEKGASEEREKKTPPPTGQALEKQIKIEKAKFKESFPMLTAMLSGFREEEIFSLPGSRKSLKGFKSDGERVVLAVMGDEVLAAIKKLSESDAFWKKTVAASGDPLKDNSGELEMQVFGAPLPFEAVYAGGKNLFDYEAEVAEAQSAYPALVENLGLSSKARPVPAELKAYEKFKSIRLAGVSLIFESDETRGIRPNSQEKGCTLYLLGELEGAAEKVGEMEITEAVGDNGRSLINQESGGFFQSPQLSEDKTAVVLPVALLLPEPGVKKIRKLSGNVSLTIVAGGKPHDLGLLKLAAGTRAKEYGLEITRAGKAPDSPETSIVGMKMNIASDLLNGITFTDESGKIMEYLGSSSSCMDDACEMEFTFEGKLPKKATITVDAYDSVNTVKTAFEVNDLPLAGGK